MRPRTQCASVLQKKRSSLKKKIANIPRISGVLPEKRSSEIFREVSGLLQQNEKKNGYDLGPFLTNQKMVLSRTGHFCKELELRAGHFRGLAGFEAKDFKLCPRRLHL